MIKVLIILGFFSANGGNAADSGFHVFEGTDTQVVMADCERVRQALLKYALANQGLWSGAIGYYRNEALVCIPVE